MPNDRPSTPRTEAGRSVAAETLRVVVPYVIVAGAWIVFSDRLVGEFAADDATQTYWSTLKGLLFVVVTAALLWVTVSRRIGRLGEAQQALSAERTRLRTVLDSIPDLVWLKDSDGRYVACNPAFERFMGFSEQELVGRDDYAFFDRDLAEFFRGNDASAARAGKPTVNSERVTYRTDGTVHDLETIKTPVTGETGVTGVLGIARDVTDALRTARELEETATQFRGALSAALLGTWRFDLTTGRFRLDERAREHYGLDRAEVRIDAVLERVHPADRARLQAEIARARDNTSVDSTAITHRVYGRDGAERWLSVHIGFVREGEGIGCHAVLVYATTQDVTERLRVDERLRAQEALIREAGAVAHVGGWEVDAATGRGTWTEEVARIHDVDPGVAPDAAMGLGFFHGESRVRIEAAFKEAVERGQPYDLELELVSAKGTHKWVRTIGHAVLESGKVVRVRGAIQDVTERRHAQDTVNRFVSVSPAVIYALRIEPHRAPLVWVSGNLEAVTGWNQQEVTAESWWSDNLHPEDRERVLSTNAASHTTAHQILEFRFMRKDGEYIWVRDEKRLLRDAQGHPTEIVGSWTDVTARVLLEDQLRQAQKLEAIGRLAGGVAHDFNNILTIVAGNADLLGNLLSPGSAELELLREIRDAGERAAGLTRQLLAFSRSQVLAPEVIDVNLAVARMESMLRRLIGEDIVLSSRLSPVAGLVRVDPGQLEQVLLNLAVNARDAMPNGGRLTIETSVRDVDEAFCRLHPQLAQGGYVRLAMSDTGQGMRPDVRARVFEPFFTTKGPSKGTGLGLATVFGIVSQSGGHIVVSSEVGAGSCFEIYLPQVCDTAATGAGRVPTVPASSGHETILLVEDEESVRKIARLALESRGYEVLCAADGHAAMALMDQHRDRVAIVVSDLVMPQMSGRELAQILRDRHPGLKVLFMSGYVEDALERHGLAADQEAFINKPFSLSAFAEKVREMLDRDRPGQGAPP